MRNKVKNEKRGVGDCGPKKDQKSHLIVYQLKLNGLF